MITDHIDQLSPEQLDLLLRRLQSGAAEDPDRLRARERAAGGSPLSFSQERLWFLDQLRPGSPAYNIPAAFRLTGRLDRDVLARCLDEVVRRHEVLRTTFAVVDGRAVQVVGPAAGGEVAFEDLSGTPEHARREAVERITAEEARRPFDLAQGPLLRATLLRTAVDEHVLLLSLHHIIADAWSLGILLREIAALYGAFSRGAASPLPELPVQYADYAVWQREWLQGERLASQLGYWKRQLADLPVLELPADRPRPAVQSWNGRRRPVVLPEVPLAALKALGEREGGTLFISLLAAFEILLYRYTGEEDVAVGTAVANRNRPEVEGLIGFFVDTLVMRGRVRGGASGRELLREARETALAGFAHQDLPFEALVAELKPERTLSHNPLVQVVLGLQNAPLTLELPGTGLAVSALETDNGTSKLDLYLLLWEEGEGLAGTVEYSTDLFEDATVLRLVRQLESLVTGLIAAPGRPVRELPMLTSPERQQLLIEWNDTRDAALLTAGVCLHELIARQAERAPEAVAAVCAGRELSYGELAARANRLAHLLRSVGIGRGAPVGVWIERSFDMLTAVLGVLETGGHYVALDDAWPADRVEAILAATGAPALITGGGLLSTVEEMRWRLPALSDVVCPSCAEPQPPAEALDPESVRELWDVVAERAVDRVTAGGFISAFTGLPMSDAEVDEYRDHVLALAGPWLHPQARVLEIGNGSGLLFWELASHVSHATGIDPSLLTQERNRERAAREGVANVELLTGFAHEAGDLVGDDRSFDLVVLASTVQFFPGPRYLERVVRWAFSRLAPGGALLIADVLDARRRGELQRAIAESKGSMAAPGTPRQELYLDEDLFRDLGVDLPVAAQVSVHHRSEGFPNELRFRYDVVLARDPRGAERGGARRKRLWTGWHLDRSDPGQAGRLPAVSTPDDVAYVIHTSGSTGEPKGIAVQHRPAVHLVEWVNRTCGIGPGDRGLFVTSLCFDLSVYDIFGLLAAGGTVHVATPEELDDPDRLVRLLRTGAITLWDSAPAALAQLAPFFPAEPDAASRLRWVLLSGDWIPVTLPDRVRQAFPEARVLALGGATEATVWSNWFPVDRIDPLWPSIPYGRPIANARYHVLDGGLAPCPIGVPGDLYIGGDCLCVGYAGRPDLTAPAFLPDPFASLRDLPGARLYRTGDRARYGADGNLEILGRLDQQVKVRGYRIELGEIEVALARQPGVREAVVVVREDEPGDRRLVAYVVPTGEPAPAADLRSALRRVLPEYMVPSAFVTLGELPVTPNGKLDRRALPAPQWSAGVGAAAAQTPMEEILAAIWSQILGVPELGREDGFFELGGHSLLATQMVSRVRAACGVELPLRVLFARPKLADFAEAVEAALSQAGRLAAPALRPVARTGSGFPLSFAQQRLWFLDQLEPGSPLYNIPNAVDLTGPLDVPALAASFAGIVRRHEVLRTIFGEGDGGAVQEVLPALAVPLPVVDLSAVPTAVRAQETARLSAAEARRPFDLSRDPLLRTTLLVTGPEEHALLVSLHHIVSDGWSMGVLMRELSAFYRAARTGGAALLPELAIQYADYAAWQRQWLTGEALDSQMGYWRQKLAGQPVLELPTDRPRPAVETFRGTNRPVTFAAGLTGPLSALARAEGATLYMVLLAGFKALLASYTGRADLVVGSPVANRNRRETEDLIGFFANTLVMRTSLAGAPSFRALLGRVRETALGAYAHQELPFEKLVEELQPQRDLSRNPLFQVMLVLQNAPLPPLDLPGVSLAHRRVDPGTAKFDVLLFLWEERGRLEGLLEYSTDLFDAPTLQRFVAHYEALLARAVADPDLPVAALAGPTGTERHQILAEWNDTRLAFAAERCVHQWVEEQVAATPGAIALVSGARELTYVELNAEANRLAHHLRRLGVGPDVLVGICVDRSWEMVVGLLGVLKAGGAGVALDPTYPEERLRYIIADARLPVLLTEEKLLPMLPDAGIHRIRLDADWPLIAAESPENPVSGVDPGNMMYAIYTSGSTGQPKGIGVPHRTFVNLLEWQLGHSQLAPRARTVQFATFGFCVSFQEIFSTLCSGGTLVLVGEDRRRDIEALWIYLEGQRIERLHLPFAALKQLADVSGREGRVPESLKEVITAGEQLQIGRSIRGLFSRIGQCSLHNQYGASETHVVSSFRLDGAPAGWPDISPVGRPVANARIYLLDGSLEPVPAGVAGELYAGGACLPRGYLGSPVQTAQKLVPDPFGSEPGERLYRTGDLARYLPDGRIEYFGRIDSQVKIRGFRVELGEVETVLKQHLGVRDAAVAAPPGPGGAPRLVAYVVPQEEGEVPKDLRAFLKARLPEHMVPGVFVPLTALPLNANGKLDREALPAPQEGGGGEGFVAPAGPVEEVLAQLWAKVLGVSQVGARDSFFDLGGHSLLVTQVVNRVRRNFAIDLPLRAFFEAPTVAELARAVVARETKPGQSERIARALLTVRSLSGEQVKEQIRERKEAQA